MTTYLPEMESVLSSNTSNARVMVMVSGIASLASAGEARSTLRQTLCLSWTRCYTRCPCSISTHSNGTVRRYQVYSSPRSSISDLQPLVDRAQGRMDRIGMTGRLFHIDRQRCAIRASITIPQLYGLALYQTRSSFRTKPSNGSTKQCHTVAPGRPATMTFHILSTSLVAQLLHHISIRLSRKIC